MDAIDIEIDQLEGGVPEDIDEFGNIDIDTMLKANRSLRDKIKEISDLVVTAVTRAEVIKKAIVTHRDLPDDIEVRTKTGEINQFQDMINSCK